MVVMNLGQYISLSVNLRHTIVVIVIFDVIAGVTIIIFFESLF